MALPLTAQAKYWGIAAVVFLLLLWFLGNVLLPFLVGGAIAYFLDPVADRLERAGLSRVSATTVISLVALLAVVLLVLAVIPTLVNQLTALVNSAPDIAKRLQGFLIERFPDLTDNTSTIRQTLAEIAAAIQARGAELANGLLTSALGVISAVVFIVVVPVVAFYLLLDWDMMVARIDGMLPLDHAPTLRRLASEIDAVLAGFVRGQISVCLLLGTFYSIALMFAGLQFGLVVGAIAGAITFIPYVGSIIGGTLAVGLALFQFWGDWVSIGIVAAIFAAGQFIEGNILTPKLVGKSVGLHPVWLLFALSAFGSVFGFVGMLIAVPVAASIGVLTRFGISQYQSSLLYKGTTARLDPPASPPPPPLRKTRRPPPGDAA
ncbi:MAG: AI-2E family transporter [Tabrizicola sp.]|uniref:AI-2E family transporter n=1 Tax=Tabrizicola sp. TaxID=2005166 RepID=UPI0027352C4E|nr:AI-2E family transporter [Tabrizicola sp.]MDP3263675.1 AI-2E family transporter [Tabrizicola sp.]MDP3647039.1 AI-2E family transporter [Paracoccaceae bacterium]